MDRLRKSRTPTRANFTRILNEIKFELAKLDPEVPDEAVVLGNLMLLEKVFNKLEAVDDQIKELMLDGDVDPDDILHEESQAVNYAKEWTTINFLVEKFQSRSKCPSPVTSEYSTTGGGENKKRNFKLPKIELKKFNGELKEWLGYWSQFQKIHEDETLHNTDKFQYLIQSLVKGSEAHEILSSFPQTAENYNKAVEALKKRFGKETLLVQVYVRELLKLALNNITQKDEVPFARMVIKLKSHLRALESLKLAAADP